MADPRRGGRDRGREGPDGSGGPDEPSDGRGPGGSLGTTSPAALTGFAVVGLIGGWLLHPVGERITGVAPVVTWAQPLLLVLMAVILGAIAWSTWRAVHVRRERLDPQSAVNRLVLGRACALVGALVGAGYLGYAVSWIGYAQDAQVDRLVRSSAAGLAGVAITVTALLLERACRVRTDDDEA